ncbi:DUF1707 domain-containing protein [Pseudonocardia xishanensis]|uniref:DUF1707 domain-containing protein n=1 Tax=Pseudonocardia xishanensis TaxID=630995 RepID=A0ABP8RWV4_9PSEU
MAVSEFPAGSRRRRADATDDDRAQTVAALGAAVDDGLLGLDEAGRRVVAVYRTTTVAGLAALLADLAPERADVGGGPQPPPDDRAQYGWAVARIVVCALVSLILIVLVLRGLAPTVLP